MTDSALTPTAFAAALARGEVVEPGAPITATYRAQLARLIIELASARLTTGYLVASQLVHAPGLSVKTSLAQQVTDRVRQSHELFRLLDALGVDAAEHVLAVDAHPPLATPTAVPFGDHSPAGTGVVRDGSWYPAAAAAFKIASFDDFAGYNSVVGCAQATLVSELHNCSWGPLRRVARAISREDLPHRAASLRLLVDPTARTTTPAAGGHLRAQQRLDRWFGEAMTWFATCDATFASSCVELRLRTRDVPGARRHFEQQLRELATTAELAVPAFITAQ